MTEINPEFTPELLASKVASILKFDERTIPYFEKLFQNIQPTPKTGASMMKIGNYTLLIQYPQKHEISQTYNFTVIALNLIEKNYVNSIHISVRADSDDDMLFTGRTDENGWCGVSMVLPYSSKSPEIKTIKVIAQDSKTGEQASTSFKVNVFSRSKPTSQQTHIFLITDKSLYKLGEEVRYIAICWADFDGCYFPLTKTEDTENFSIKLINSDEKTLFEQYLEPTPYGIVWGDFPVVENLPEGIYTLRLQYKDNYASNSTIFEVKQYQRPEIEVLEALDSKWYLKLEPEEGYEYPIQVKYFYGDPVKNCSVKFQLKKVTGAYTTIVEYKEPLILTDTYTDEYGQAVIKFKPTEQWLTNMPIDTSRVNLETFREWIDTGRVFTLDVVLKLEDDQGRITEKTRVISCLLNIFELKNQKIIFNPEKNQAKFQGRIVNAFNEGFTGPVQVKLDDYYNTVLPIDETISISEGKLEIPLMSRTVFGLAPSIDLNGTISYYNLQRTNEIQVSVHLKPKEKELKIFELKLPELIETGKPLSVELISKTYKGPVWLFYGKNEIFAQINGMIIDESGSFKHSITIPKSYVGNITCIVNYFDFEDKMEVNSTKITFSVSIEQHLLSYSVHFPSNARPGEKIVAKILKDKRSLEPWLLALKLVDKSLRGLEAITEFDLETIYTLTQELSISTFPIWTNDLDNILKDLGTMIEKVLNKSNYEPNLFICLLQLDKILRSNYDRYEHWSGHTNQLMNTYFHNLKRDMNNVLDFFKALTPENSKLAASVFGDFFFPDYSLNFKTFESFYNVIFKKNLQDSKVYGYLLDYFNRMFLKKLENIEKKGEPLYFLTSLEISSIELLERLKKIFELTIDFGKKNSTGSIIPVEIISVFRKYLTIISNRSFAKHFFLLKYKYTPHYIGLLDRLSTEIKFLEKFELLEDKDVLLKYIESVQSAIKNLNFIFKEKIELEKDENWNVFNSVINFLKKIKHKKLIGNIKEINNHLFSKKFYKEIYGGSFYYVGKNYKKLEEDVKKINLRPDIVQRNALFELILKGLNKELYNSFSKFDISKLISDILYERYYVKYIVNIIDWEGLHGSIKKSKDNLEEKLQTRNYLSEIIKKVLEKQRLDELIEILPDDVIATIILWQKRAYGEKKYEFSQIGDFPSDQELDTRAMFDDTFGKKLTEIYAIIFEELGKSFLHNLKKGDYKFYKYYAPSIDLEGSYYYFRFWSYVNMLYFINNVETYFNNLTILASEYQGKLKGLQNHIETINKENLFNVFYLYFLTKIKLGDMKINNFYQFKKVLKVFSPENFTKKKIFQFDDKSSLKDEKNSQNKPK